MPSITNLGHIDECIVADQALAREEHELAEADSRFLVVDGLRVHYKAAPAPDDWTGPGATQRSSEETLCVPRYGTGGCCSAQLPYKLLAPARLPVLRTAVMPCSADLAQVVRLNKPGCGHILGDGSCAIVSGHALAARAASLLTAGREPAQRTHARVGRAQAAGARGRRAWRSACCTALAPMRSAGRTWTGSWRRGCARRSPRTTCPALGSRSGARCRACKLGLRGFLLSAITGSSWLACCSCTQNRRQCSALPC